MRSVAYRDLTAQLYQARRTTETQCVGGTGSVTNYLYTFVAAWNPERRGWIKMARRLIAESKRLGTVRIELASTGQTAAMANRWF